MRYYAEQLRKRRFATTYISADEKTSDVRALISFLAHGGTKEIHFVEVIDDWLEQRLRTECRQHRITLVQYASPNFLNSHEEAHSYFEGKRTYFQTGFYIDQRKRHGILLDRNGKPAGGKWSFDQENRQRFPGTAEVPQFSLSRANTFVTDARNSVNREFPANYGNPYDPFPPGTGSYPVTDIQAECWLDDFLEHRLEKFGHYEDAIVARAPVLHHSVLTPVLNIGLLTPQMILDRTLEHRKRIPLNSLEGFIRQVLGWREFIRVVYEREGRRQRTRNFWGFSRRIPPAFWTGETGIFPVDTVIRKVLASGYCHHIERLMVLGNFMLLCEFHPDDVYRWFMEMFIDAYDWVMVPNVYGMSQFADGGIMSTKPYISGSNYLMKMSDFPKGDWQEIWDGLFWRFMHVHRDFFLQNPRLGMLVRTFDRMDTGKRKKHLATAERYLASL